MAGKGGKYTIVVQCVQADVRMNVASIQSIYEDFRMIEQEINGIVFRWLGGPRDDQTILEIIKGFLVVKLQCFTDERFMEVWEDYESRRLKARLLDEFWTSHIEVKGLKIDIENLEEVNKTRTQIESRKRIDIVEMPTRPSPEDTPVTGMARHETRIYPGIIVRGSAFSAIINAHREMFRRAIKEAAREGYNVLMQEGKTAIDAVEEAVRIMEDNGLFNAAAGSFLNENGAVECDAMIMDGNTMNTGAVMAVKQFKNPVSLSREVMKRTPHCALGAEGALKFAQKINFPICDPAELTEKTILRPIISSKDYLKFVNNDFIGWRLEEGDQQSSGQQVHDGDTVAAVAIDSYGHLACATSTGGLPGKMEGRIGDAPLVGCGGYANEFGAAASNGHGEALMKMTLARDVVFNMENGLNAQESAEKSVKRMQDRIQGYGSIIAIDKDGNFGKASNTKFMIWASAKNDELNYGILHDECKTETV